MQLDDLYVIGRLGNVVKNGYVEFKPYKIFQPAFFTLNDFFLFFPDHSVRYSKICDIKRKLKYLIKFSDVEVLYGKEIKFPIKLAVSRDDIEILEKGDKRYLINMKLYSKKQFCGKVVDIFYNGAHWVIVAKCDSKIVMLPFVDEFVKSIDRNSNMLHYKNIDQFFDL